MPAASVASAMASAPPLRACPRAAAHAANLRALRTAVAGYTVLSIVFQVRGGICRVSVCMHAPALLFILPVCFTKRLDVLTKHAIKRTHTHKELRS